MSGNARSRAAEVLDVPTDATPNAAMSAFLIQLAKTRFVPPGNVVAALNTLSGLGLPVNAENSGALRDEVEEFAERYWMLTPAERLSNWLKLSTRSPDDSTANRLLSLQAGLELPGTPYPDSKVERLTSIARELYVLPVRERAIRRGEWLLANAGRQRELIALAATIRKDQPTIADLDPVLFSRLTPQFYAGLFAEAATASPLPEKPFAPAKTLDVPAPTTPFSKPKPWHTPERIRPTPHRERAMSFLIIIALIVVFNIFVSLSRSGPSSIQNNFEKPQTIPSYQPKSPKPPRYLPERESNGSESYYLFTEKQVESFKRYEEEKRGGEPPLFYFDWFLAGKPEANEHRIKSKP